MSPRNLLLIPLLDTPLGFLETPPFYPDWKASICKEPDEAIIHVSNGHFLVGILSLDQAPEKIEIAHRLIDHAPLMEWIALIPAMPEYSDKFNYLLVNHFNDFHTLPANPP
ncbi:MAG: hypothetical protein KGL58_00915, partial [Pseudomonadota bacterium]|nr:hypothetical protein [Pseudomonadota bacterium]